MDGSKFVLNGVQVKKVEGFTTDPKRRSEAAKQFGESTKKFFEAYDIARRKSLELAAKRFLD